MPISGVIGKSDRVDWQQRWDERYSGTEFQVPAPPSEFVVAELAGLAPGRALDLAAGAGRHSVWLAARGWSVTAVDFSRAGLEKARQLSAAHGVGDGQVDWVVADLSDHAPPRDAFELVLVTYLQVEAPLRAKVLAGAAAALAPGGTLLVVGYDLTNLTDGVGGPQTPDVLYTPESITAELAGLSILRAGRVSRAVERDGATATAIDTLVRAERTRGIRASAHPADRRGRPQDADALGLTDPEEIGDALWEGEEEEEEEEEGEEGDGDALWVGEGEADGDVLADGDGVADGEADALAVGEEDAVGDAGAGEEEDAGADDDAGEDSVGAADSVGAEVLDGVTVAAEDGLRNSDGEGLPDAFGVAAAADADDAGRGLRDAGAVVVGVVSAAPARGWYCGADGRGTAPVRTKTAAADAATSPPVIPADAIGRDRRCRARRPSLPGSAVLSAAPANGMMSPDSGASWSSAAGCPAAAP